MYVCLCNAVTDGAIRESVGAGAATFSDLRARLKVGTSCGKCSPCARAILRDELANAAASDGCACAAAV